MDICKLVDRSDTSDIMGVLKRHSGTIQGIAKGNYSEDIIHYDKELKVMNALKKTSTDIKFHAKIDFYKKRLSELEYIHRAIA